MFLQLFACFCNLEKRPRYQKTAFYQLTDQLFGKWKAHYPLRHKGLRVFAFPTFYQLAVYIAVVMIASATCGVLMASESVRGVLTVLPILPVIIITLAIFVGSWALSVKWFKAREL